MALVEFERAGNLVELGEVGDLALHLVGGALNLAGSFGAANGELTAMGGGGLVKEGKSGGNGFDVHARSPGWSPGLANLQWLTGGQPAGTRLVAARRQE